MDTLSVQSDEQLDRAWGRWQAKNRRQDIADETLHAKLIKYASITVLLVAIAGWSYAADYHILVRFAVCACAVRIALLAIAARQYSWTAVFAGMALLYNPLFPVFALSGRTDLLIVAASIAPFVASLIALKAKPAVAR